MIIKKEVERYDVNEVTIYNKEIKVSIFYDKKTPTLIKYVEINSSHTDSVIIPPTKKPVLAVAAKYTLTNVNTFEKHLKHATNYLLRHYGTKYQVIETKELEDLVIKAHSHSDMWNIV